MNILVMGTGYVGLVSGACYTQLGHQVTCFDIDKNKIEELKNGKVPWHEPELNDIITDNDNLVFSHELESIDDFELILIAVGTPPRPNGEADLGQIYKVAEHLSEKLNNYTVIVTKSTVPVGTNRKIKKIIEKNYSGEFDVASCPEFLREGNAVKDFQNPDRIVIGTDSQKAKDVLLELHNKLDCPKVTVNLETAEMIKYAANAFLATKISFINEISNICEHVGANVSHVAEGIGHDKRIGKHFLDAGIGYGGSCFPKDVRALHHISGFNGYQFQLLKSVIEVNNHQKWLFFRKLKNELQNIENKKIGILGLAFKPNTDDIREAIALDIIEKLLDEDADVKVYDPKAMPNIKSVFENKINYCLDAEHCAEDADALLIITEWPDFKKLNLQNIKNKMNNPLIIDGRNLFEPQEMEQLGFKYLSMGR